MEHREFNPNESWDEYRWERYLRENDRRCEQFAALLEANLHHSDRDRVIAREMGWHHLLESREPGDALARHALFLELIDLMLAGDEMEDEAALDEFPLEGSDFDPFDYGTPSIFGMEDERRPHEDVFEVLEDDVVESEEMLAMEQGPLGGMENDFESEIGTFLNGDEEDEDDDEDLASHPLCDLAATYQAWLERLLQDEPELVEDPRVARLTTYSAICGAKVRSALEDGDEYEDLGMTIAYLKRGLKAINTALEATFQLGASGIISHARAEELRTRVFRIRDGIIELMGHYRLEWMKRIDE